MQLQLDVQTLKALSSKTRVDILKLLGQRRHMQSELANLLNLSVPTVKEHLNALEKARLVEKHEEGRKWKYYSLTKKGKAVLQPSEVTVLLVLGLLVLSIIGGVMTTIQSTLKVYDSSMEMTQAVAKAAIIAPAQTPWHYGFAIVTIIFAIILALTVQTYLQRKQLGK